MSVPLFRRLRFLRRMDPRRSIAMWAILGLTAGLLVTVVGARPSLATCGPQQWTRVRLGPNGRGLASFSMTVFNTSVDCARGSFMLVENDTATRGVHVGWYEDPADIFLCVPKTGVTPKVYAAAWEQPYWKCLKNPTNVGAGSHDFRVHDDNQDGIWQFLADGSPVWSYDLGSFVTGLLWDSGERVSVADSARSDFNTVKRMGADAAWSNPTDAYEAGPGYSFDPDFKPCIYNNGAHTTVVTNATSC